MISNLWRTHMMMFSAQDLDEFVGRSENEQNHSNRKDRTAEPERINEETHTCDYKNRILTFFSFEEYAIGNEKRSEHADDINYNIGKAHVGNGLEKISEEIHSKNIKNQNNKFQIESFVYLQRDSSLRSE